MESAYTATGVTDDSATESALAHWPSQFRFWLTAVLFAALDLWSKNWAFSSLPLEDGRVIIPGFLEFRRSLNDGAVFGSFTGYVGVFIVASLFALLFVLYLFAKSTPRQRVLHVALALVLSGALGNLYDRAFIQADVAYIVKNDKKVTTFIGVRTNEASESVIRMGHWPDGRDPRTLNPERINLRRQGVVRDFIKLMPKFPKWVPIFGGYDTWPWVFNVADAALVCGVAILLLLCLFERNPRPAPIPLSS